MSRESHETIRVRYGETDQMGHAYYANYLFWFEQARGTWCRDRGMSYREMEARGWFLPVVEAHVRYKGEVHYDDLIEVKVWISDLRRTSIRFDYVVTKLETGQVTTEGHTVHVVMGLERRAISIPAELRAWLEGDAP